MNLLFRVDFGPEVGLGHLQRSASLAAALAKSGVTSFFLTNNLDGGSDYVARLKFERDVMRDVQSWTSDDAHATLKVASARGCRAVMVDSHEVRADYLSRLRKAGLFVIARDDLACYPFPCQMVVNGNADARELPYFSSSGDTVFLLGPEYAVLPPEFCGTASRVIRDTPTHLLIILGGADPRHLMPKVLALLDDMPGNFVVTAVVGPLFDNAGEVQTAALRAIRKIRVVYSPQSLSDLMLEADVAISAAGQTLYELAWAGCPTIAVRAAANQDGQLKALVAAGVTWDAGCADDGNVIARLGHSVSSLLADRSARATMSAAGRRLVDGQGALRVTQATVEETARRPGAGL